MISAIKAMILNIIYALSAITIAIIIIMCALQCLT